MKISIWQIISKVIGILLVLIGSLFICFPELVNHFLSKNIEPNPVILGRVFLIAESAILLIDFRSWKLRQNWRLPGIILLFVFTAVTLFLTFTNAASTNSNSDSIFNLPADKIQTDLSRMQPHSPILLILTDNNEVYSYDATLSDVSGAGNVALIPPYKNKDATIVHVTLINGNNETIELGFADRLANTKAIFLLPEPSSPTPIAKNVKRGTQSSPVSTPTPTTRIDTQFSLPINKLHLSTIKDCSAITLFLVENHQVYRYDAKVTEINAVSIAPTPGSKPTCTLSPNGKITSITISLTNPTDQTIADFIDLLSNASAIYLLPSPIN